MSFIHIEPITVAIKVHVSAFSRFYITINKFQKSTICSIRSSREMKITFLALLVSTVMVANAGLITSDGKASQIKFPVYRHLPHR